MKSVVEICPSEQNERNRRYMEMAKKTTIQTEKEEFGYT
jgi:hypothetical protein